MRVAYEAADASHPKGAVQARREQENFNAQGILANLHAATVFIGRAIPEKGADRTVTILTTR
jgi:hypothetical protein